jgi:molybdate transport system ATP-binding protein
VNGLEARFRHSLGEFALDVEFTAASRGVTALFGPSGSGKTSVLRCLAGLERAREGRLTLDGECWQDETRGRFVPAHRRACGYVFQEASLFPHLTVRRNLEYGWKRLAGGARRVAFESAVELLGLAPFLARMPDRLSGGERSRVAIARALLTSPRLLLMDEPLASLDVRSKSGILPYLERLHRELAIPVVYVSHSPDEVARLADHLVLIEKGRVRAAGAVAETLARLDLPLAHGDEACAMVEATVASHDDHYQLTQLEFAGGEIQVPRLARAPGERVRVRVHARDVSLALERPARTSILNIFSGTVAEVAEENPSQLMVRLDVRGTALLARVTRKSGAALGLKPGKPLFVQVKSVALLG